jgi:hypothetical protein
MKNNIALIIDTNFNYSDVWPPCFGRLDKYASGIKKYAFTDKSDGMPEDITPVYYDNNVSYRNQFLSCIEKIEEQYVIYTSEDYYLYDYVNQEKIIEISEILDNSEYRFCKFVKGPERVTPYKDNLYVIDFDSNNLFAQQAALWETRALESIFRAAPSENNRMQHEPGGSDICRQLGIRGLQHYGGNPKRGLQHYDSTVYPCIATAVVKGVWNISEYPEEMKSIINEFNIDCRKRGWR